MKTLTIISLFLILLTGNNLNAQEVIASEKYGKTLNAGIGVGYYGYIGHTLPVLSANFELDVARNFTLAPFVTVYSYQNYYYWGNPDKPYRNYSYRTTVVPVGVKGTYYFDQLLKAGPKWDFYLAGSLGFAFRKTTWESGYDGTYVEQHSASGLYLDGHIGTEFHVSKRAGLFLDLSSGISTFGLAFHL